MVRNRGFTLIEVLVAMAIIGMCVFLVSNTWSGNLLRLRKSTLNHNVASLLERKATELEIKYRDRPLTEIPESENGDFGEGFPQYQWKMTTQELNMPDISAAIVGQGSGKEMLLTVVKQMQEFMAKAVKEAKISVMVKAGQRELEYSVTTYFIDYNSNIAIPGLGGMGGAAGGTGGTGGTTPGGGQSGVGP